MPTIASEVSKPISMIPIVVGSFRYLKFRKPKKAERLMRSVKA
jgi:hypothetical protein